MLKSLDSSRMFDTIGSPILSIHLQAKVSSDSADPSSTDLETGVHNSWRLSPWSKKLHGAGLFIVDEKNSVMIESYFIGGKWFQRFEVAGSMLICTIEQQRENLIWEISSGKSKKISTSGDTKIDGIYEVNTYPFGVYQKAVLTKF